MATKMASTVEALACSAAIAATLASIKRQALAVSKAFRPCIDWAGRAAGRFADIDPGAAAGRGKKTPSLIRSPSYFPHMLCSAASTRQGSEGGTGGRGCALNARLKKYQIGGASREDAKFELRMSKS